MKRAYTVSVQQASDDSWYWHVRAPNRLVIAQGVGYNSKAKALRAIRRLITICQTAPIRFAV